MTEKASVTFDPLVSVDREGIVSWSWCARGVLRRAQRVGQVVHLPTGRPTTVGMGYALTRRGAERKARRALQRWT
jgi:hypothetical protein